LEKWKDNRVVVVKQYDDYTLDKIRHYPRG
jgi:hypothetical protein